MMTAAPSSRIRVLLVDDDRAIRDSLGPYLTRSGFEVITADDGLSGLVEAKSVNPDVIVSDIIMPGLDGRDMVRRLRSGGDWTPVILLTNVGDAAERSDALDEGADDYLNKPFDPRELVSRIRVLLRRTIPGQPSLSSAERLVSDGLVVDRVARRFWLDQRELQLTPKASLLLDYLMTHPEELLTRQALLAALWGFDFPVSSRAVDHRVAELRRELREDASQPRFIKTVPSGYRFCREVRRG